MKCVPTAPDKEGKLIITHTHIYIKFPKEENKMMNINNLFKTTTPSVNYTNNDSIKNAILTAHKNEIELYDVINDIEAAEDIHVWHTQYNTVHASFTFHDRKVEIVDMEGIITLSEDSKVIAEVYRSMITGLVEVVNQSGKKWVRFLAWKIARIMSLKPDSITFPAEGMTIGNNEYTVDKNKILINGKEIMKYTMTGSLSWVTIKEKEADFVKKNFMVK